MVYVQGSWGTALFFCCIEKNSDTIAVSEFPVRIL